MVESLPHAGRKTDSVKRLGSLALLALHLLAAVVGGMLLGVGFLIEEGCAIRHVTVNVLSCPDVHPAMPREGICGKPRELPDHTEVDCEVTIFVDGKPRQAIRKWTYRCGITDSQTLNLKQEKKDD